MAKQTVGLGSSANDGTGDSIRSGGDKINDNFLMLSQDVPKGRMISSDYYSNSRNI